HAVNAGAPGVLASECARIGALLVHFSTDYVFPGSGDTPYLEEERAEPINEYGLSKLRGEQSVLRSGARALVIRTQWLFGAHGSSFPRTMLDSAGGALPTRGVADQWGWATYSRDLRVLV